MTIDKSGKWWKGSSPEDLNDYLKEFSGDSYPIDRFALLHCQCDSTMFAIEIDEDEECGKGICSTCGESNFIADSQENWGTVAPRKYECIECHSKEANIGLGFALTEDHEAVKWIFLGCRCAKCGVLGCMIDWKISYEPSLHFIPNA